MIVNTHNPEFGYELIGAIPYAYYLFKNFQLEKTISAPLSEPLYYFSPNHEINPERRGDEGVQKYINSGIPNARIHKPFLDTRQFIPPPYKQHFKNDTYKWSKPTFCICNRYNYEWGMNPINYFSLEMLEKMFNLLKDTFQIVYFGVDIIDDIQDDAHSLSLGDTDLCKKYPDVILFQDLLKESGLSWNELMLKVFSNCENFITMNGGYSIMASYFGGTNIIYCKQSSEIGPNSSNFSWYNLFGNSNIILTRTYEDVIDKIKEVKIFFKNK